MDYNVNKEFLSVKEIIFDGCQEQAVDLDFSLPDYCPDIQRILKCQVYPSISSKSLSGDRLDVDGVATVRLMYLDSIKMAIRCCEHSIPFSCSFNIKNDAQDAIAKVSTKVDYLNCRAISPRRLDIHGAFSVCAKVISKSQQEIVSDLSGVGLQQKKKMMRANNIIGMGQQVFSINETLEIGSGKPAAEAIIRTDVSSNINDYKTIANKVIIKGEAQIKVLYISDLDTGNVEIMEYSIPISQIIDVNGIDENCTCDVDINVLNHDMEIRQDGSGNDMLLELDMKLDATAIAYEEKPIELIEDAYSTDYEVEREYKNTSVDCLLDKISETYSDKVNIENIEGGVTEVIDIWGEILSSSCRYEDNKIMFRGKMLICILAVNKDDQTFYIEKTVDFEHSKDWADRQSQIKCDTNIRILSINYRISGDSEIEVKFEVRINSSIYCSENRKAINSVVIDQNRPLEKDTTAAVTIYYAEAGEDIWNIARKYCTSAEAIKEENGLDSDTLENQGMILIPM